MASPLVLAFAVAAVQAWGASLTPEVGHELRGVAHDEAKLRAAVIAAIAQRPGEAETIVAEATELAPESRDAIADAAAGAFPGFAERIRVATAVGAAPAASSAAVVAPPAWSGEISVGGARTSGNTETGEASAGLKAQYGGVEWEHDLNVLFDYGSEAEDTTKQRLLSNFESRLDLGQRLYGFGFLEYEDDRFSGFEFETTEGVGLGYRVALGRPFAWRIQAGPAARQARVESTGKTESELTGLLRSELEWQFSPSGKIANETTATVGAERTVARNVASITVQLIGELAGRLSLDVQHNTAPPPRAEATDTTTRVSLVYGF